MTDAELARFMAKIVVAPEGCWLWQGARLKRGPKAPKSRPYGIFVAGGKTRLAHQLSYEHFVGPIPLLPSGRRVGLDHFACDTPPCVNYEHLRPATSRENTLRGSGPSATNARKTHCPKGHAYDEANTWIDKTGRRHCRACESERSRRWHVEHGAEYMREYRRRKREE